MTNENPVIPAITPHDIELEIVAEYFFTAYDGYMGAHDAGTLVAQESPTSAEELKRTTICVLVLRGGYTVTGVAGVLDIRRNDPAIGRDTARKNAVDQIWPMLGYMVLNQEKRVAYRIWRDGRPYSDWNGCPAVEGVELPPPYQVEYAYSRGR